MRLSARSRLVKVLAKLSIKLRNVKKNASVRKTSSIRRRSCSCVTLKRTVNKRGKIRLTRLRESKSCWSKSTLATRSQSRLRQNFARRRRSMSNRSLLTNVPRTLLKRRKRQRLLELPLRRRRNCKDFLPFKRRPTIANLRLTKLKRNEQERKLISLLVLAMRQNKLKPLRLRRTLNMLA